MWNYENPFHDRGDCFGSDWRNSFSVSRSSPELPHTCGGWPVHIFLWNGQQVTDVTLVWELVYAFSSLIENSWLISQP